MKQKLSEEELNEWETTLSRLGKKYNVTLQLAEVIGKRWSYLVGPTASMAGLMGIYREELGDGLGIIIFPHAQAFSEAEKQGLLGELLPPSK